MSLTCLFAFVRGRWPERVAAIALAVNWVSCAMLEDRRVFHNLLFRLHAQPAIAAIDVLYDLVLLHLLLTVSRRWVIGAFAAQTVIVLTHAATAIDPRVTQFDFFSAYYVMSYIVVASLAVGVALEGRQLRSPPG